MMNKKSLINRRAFLKTLGISGLTLCLESKILGQPGQQERREEFIRRICDSFPDSADQIPGAGRINKVYVEDSQHLLIRIDQERLFRHGYIVLPTDDFMACVREEQLRIEQVQEELSHILSYLVSHDCDFTPYFPRNSDDQRRVYAQGLDIVSMLDWVANHLHEKVVYQMVHGVSLPNPASKRLEGIQEYLKVINEDDLMAVYQLRDEANLSVQDLEYSDPCIDEFAFGIPVATMVYSFEFPISMERRRISAGCGNKFSFIDIVPQSMVNERQE